jgi:mono/diheme cytochrome c family protein
LLACHSNAAAACRIERGPFASVETHGAQGEMARQYAPINLHLHKVHANDEEQSMSTSHRFNSKFAYFTAVGIALSTLNTTQVQADDGWFTQAEAVSGHQTFNNYCAQCHGPELTGAAGPALIGQPFLAQWSNKPLSDLYDFEHQNMPATNPGSVPGDQLWKITAYILQKNGFAAGNTNIATNASKTLPAKPSSGQ